MFGAICLFPSSLLIKKKGTEKENGLPKPKIVNLEIITHIPEYNWPKRGELEPYPDDPTEEVFLTFSDESQIGYEVKKRGWVEGVKTDVWNFEKMVFSSTPNTQKREVVSKMGIDYIPGECIKIKYNDAYMWIKPGKRLKMWPYPPVPSKFDDNTGKWYKV